MRGGNPIFWRPSEGWLTIGGAVASVGLIMRLLLLAAAGVPPVPGLKWSPAVEAPATHSVEHPAPQVVWLHGQPPPPPARSRADVMVLAPEQRPERAAQPPTLSGKSSRSLPTPPSPTPEPSGTGSSSDTTPVTESSEAEQPEARAPARSSVLPAPLPASATPGRTAVQQPPLHGALAPRDSPPDPVHQGHLGRLRNVAQT